MRAWRIILFDNNNYYHKRFCRCCSHTLRLLCLYFSRDFPTRSAQLCSIRNRLYNTRVRVNYKTRGWKLHNPCTKTFSHTNSLKKIPFSLQLSSCMLSISLCTFCAYNSSTLIKLKLFFPLLSLSFSLFFVLSCIFPATKLCQCKRKRDRDYSSRFFSVKDTLLKSQPVRLHRAYYTART